MLFLTPRLVSIFFGAEVISRNLINSCLFYLFSAHNDSLNDEIESNRFFGITYLV